MPAFLLTWLFSINTHPAKYLVCYDICHPKRLRRVHRTIRDWGIPVQLSVFEVELTAFQLTQLMEKLTEIIETTEDKVLFYRLTPNHQPICLGLEIQTDDLLFV